MDKEEFLRLLPKLIRENDEVKGAIITALSGVVATKEDIKDLIEIMDKRFESMDKRFESVQEQLDKRFESMDKRFESMDKRFESMDKRFESMDKRFESVQEQLDKRFESVQEQLDKRFESVQEQLDKRFESMDKRFESMDRRFESMDRRFESMIETINRGFEEARKDREELRTYITTVSSRAGIELEKTILNLLNDKLIKENIPSSQIKHISLQDTEGKVYYEDYSTDIDLLVQDSKTILIEVKFHADNRDIFDFTKKAELYKIQFQKEYDELLLVSLKINQKNYEQAIKQGIKVITGNIS
jgi:hypothetical protein